MNPEQFSRIPNQRKALLDELCANDQIVLRTARIIGQESSVRRSSLNGMGYRSSGLSLHDFMLDHANLTLANQGSRFGRDEDALLRIDDISRLHSSSKPLYLEVRRDDTTPMDLMNFAKMPGQRKVAENTDVSLNKKSASVGRLRKSFHCGSFKQNNIRQDLNVSRKYFDEKLLTKRNNSNKPARSRMGEFPFPGSARRMTSPALLSYKALWANPKVRSLHAKRELLRRHMHKGTVKIYC